MNSHTHKHGELPAQINITWSVDDVRAIRPDLSDTQARIVLSAVSVNHDAEFGVTWNTIQYWSDELFPY